METDNKLPHWASILADSVFTYIKQQNLLSVTTICLYLEDNKHPSVIRKIVTFELLVKALKQLGLNSLTPHLSFLNAPEEDEQHCKNLVTKLSTFLTPDATSNYTLENAIHIKFNSDENSKQTTFENNTIMIPDVKVRLKGFDSTNSNILPVNAILNCFESDLIRWLVAHQPPNTNLTFNFDEEIFKLYKLFDENESRFFDKSQGDNTNLEYEQIAYQYSCFQAPPPIKPFRPDFLKLSTLLQMYDLDISSAYAYHVHLLKNDTDKSCFSRRSEKVYNWLNAFAPASIKFSVNKHSIEINLTEKEIAFMKNVFNFIKSYEDEVEFEDLDEIGKRFEMFAKEKGLDFTHAKIVLYKHLINKEVGPTFSSFIKYLDRNKLLMLLKK
jgi:hypothetical protein